MSRKTLEATELLIIIGLPQLYRLTFWSRNDPRIRRNIDDLGSRPAPTSTAAASSAAGASTIAAYVVAATTVASSDQGEEEQGGIELQTYHQNQNSWTDASTTFTTNTTRDHEQTHGNNKNAETEVIIAEHQITICSIHVPYYIIYVSRGHCNKQCLFSFDVQDMSVASYFNREREY